MACVPNGALGALSVGMHIIAPAESSLLESQRDAGPDCSPPPLHAHLRTFLTSPMPLPSSPMGALPPSPVWGKAHVWYEGAAWMAAC